MAAPTIAASLRQFLTAHMPFSAMAPQTSTSSSTVSRSRYFAPDEVVLAPSGKVPSHCLIVKQGRVQGVARGQQGHRL